MSFTEDELQAFNSILEQRFAAHRQDMEQALDQRLSSFRQDIDKQFISLQQHMTTVLEQWLSGRKDLFDVAFSGKLTAHQDQIVETVNNETEARLHQVEAAVDRMLAAQLLGIEQLMSQYVPRQNAGVSSLAQELRPQLEAIEVQTELSWEDLTAVMGKVLDERIVSLGDSIQRSVKNLEQYLAIRLHSLRDELARIQSTVQPYNSSPNNGASVPEMLAGIENLEHILESMQVSMTANHALLSNRLYHHQHLPLERAHPAGHTHVAPTNGAGSLLAQAKERLASGLEPEASVRQDVSEESEGQ